MIRSLDDAALDGLLAPHTRRCTARRLPRRAFTKVAPPEAFADGMGRRPYLQFVGNSLKEKLDLALRNAELLRDPGLGVSVAATSSGL